VANPRHEGSLRPRRTHRLDTRDRGCNGGRGILRNRVRVLAPRRGAGYSRSDDCQHTPRDGSGWSASRRGRISHLLEGEQEKLSDIDPRERNSAAEDLAGLDFPGGHYGWRASCYHDPDLLLDLVGTGSSSLTPLLITVLSAVAARDLRVRPHSFQCCLKQNSLEKGTIRNWLLHYGCDQTSLPRRPYVEVELWLKKSKISKKGSDPRFVLEHCKNLSEVEFFLYEPIC
jgi:hypothetical protein